MKKVLLTCAALAMLLVPCSVLAVSKADVESFVKEAAAYAKENGKEQALQEFMNQDGKFFQGELYIFAYDFTGTVVSHGAKPKLVGKNLMRLKDAKGVKVIEELVALAKQGEGWLEYHWEHPVEKKVMPKLGYVVKVDDSFWIGSGMYK